jgi:hypothetical protein
VGNAQPWRSLKAARYQARSRASRPRAGGGASPPKGDGARRCARAGRDRAAPSATPARAPGGMIDTETLSVRGIGCALELYDPLASAQEPKSLIPSVHPRSRLALRQPHRLCVGPPAGCHHPAGPSAHLETRTVQRNVVIASVATLDAFRTGVRSLDVQS